MAFGSGIGIGGLSSGLDTNSIVQKLVSIESLPIQQLESKKKAQQDKQNGISKLKTLIKDLQTKAKAVATQSSFLVYDVKTSKDGIASFTANGSATAASHSLAVTQLAAVDRWAFEGVGDPDAELATGPGQQVTFQVGLDDQYVIEAEPGSSSLNNIAAAINSQENGKVTASIVNTGTSGNPSYKLVLTSKLSGEEGRISNITSDVGILAIDATPPSALGVAGSRNNITVGNNATAIVDGLTVERATNEFTDVIAGITFTAQGLNVDEPITFSAEPNKSAIKKKIQDLVDSYNAVINYTNAQNSYSKESGTGGVLFGDSLLSTVRSTIQKSLFDVPLDTISNDTTGYSTLNIIGINSGNDGTLTIDQTKLDAKLSGDLSAFSDLFVDKDGFDNNGATVNTPEYYQDTSADSGLADKLSRAIDRMLSTSAGDNGTSIKGVFDSRLDSIAKTIRGIDDDIRKKQVYVDKFENDLLIKFSNLESTMSRLKAQGSGFAAAISGLTG